MVGGPGTVTETDFSLDCEDRRHLGLGGKAQGI